MKRTNKTQSKSSTQATNPATSSRNISLVIRQVAMAYSSGMYTEAIYENLEEDGFSEEEIEGIVDTALFLQESMYYSLKNLAGISNN